MLVRPRARCATLVAAFALALGGCTHVLAPAGSPPPAAAAAPVPSPAAGAAPRCMPEGGSCAAAGARCCEGLVCGGSRQPLCITVP